MNDSFNCDLADTSDKITLVEDIYISIDLYSLIFSIPVALSVLCYVICSVVLVKSYI